MLRRFLISLKLREHRSFVVCLGIAAALRLMVLVAYRPAFWFGDTPEYLDSARSHLPHYVHQFGYSAFIWVVHRPGWTLGVITVAQHLLGLLLAVACYAFLQHRGVPKWLSLVAVAPVLFDSMQIAMEQYILSDSLFVTLLTCGILLLLWQDKPSVTVTALAGLILASAVLTRMIGLPVVVLALLYLVVRRAGWRPVATLAVVVALPLAAYVNWYHSHQGVYGFTKYQGGFIYARVATFVDCDQLDVEPRLKALCPKEQLGERLHQEYYLWGLGRPVGPGENTETAQEFSMAVIKQQPGAYLKTVGADLWHFVDPFWTPDPQTACYRQVYELPARPVTDRADDSHCDARLSDSSRTFAAISGVDRESPLTHALKAYSGFAHLPGLVPGLAVLLVLGAFLWRRSLRYLDEGLLCVGGVAMIVVATATNMHEPRFLLASVPLISIAAALCLAGLLRRGVEPVTEADEGKSVQDVVEVAGLGEERR